jgi:hypothetical protein
MCKTMQGSEGDMREGKMVIALRTLLSFLSLLHEVTGICKLNYVRIDKYK